MDFNFKFSVDELVVIVSALREEYRRVSACTILARRKQSAASTADAARDFLNMANWCDERCAKCEDLYKKIIDRDILEDM